MSKERGELSLADEEQIDKLLDQFERRWQEGKQAPSVENLLAEGGEPRKHRKRLLAELLSIEIHWRDRLNNPVSYDELLARFPNDVDVLSEISAELPTRLDVPAFTERYLPIREIARGGMGAVWRVLDQQFDRPLAVKIILNRHIRAASEVKRFEREAQLTGQLQHPAIPPIIDRGRLLDGSPYYSMKLIEGKTLTAVLAQREQNDLRGLMGVMEQICQAVGYAHSVGVIHRDLKPSNVMVGAYGEVQVMDWGMAKRLGTTDVPNTDEPTQQTGQSTHQQSSSEFTKAFVDQETLALQAGEDEDTEMTRDGTVMGTPAYMPPEQARGEVQLLDPRADVFSLGAILCEILTGQPPFSGANSLRRAATADLGPAFALLDTCQADEELVQLCKRCLSPTPETRPANGAEVAREIQTWETALQERLERERSERAALEARVAEEHKRLAVEKSRRRIVLTLAGVLVLFCLGAGAAVWATIEARTVAAVTRLSAAIESRLNEPELQPEYLTEVDDLIRELSPSDPVAALQAEEKLRQRYAGLILAGIERPKLNDAEIKELQTAITALSERDSASANQMALLLEQRSRQWQTVDEISSPLEQLPALVSTADFQLRDGRLVTLPKTAEAKYYRTRLEVVGESEFDVTFGEEWQQAESLALVIQGDDESATDYELRLARRDSRRDDSPAKAPPTHDLPTNDVPEHNFATAIAGGDRCEVSLWRGNVVLHRFQQRADLLKAEELRIRLRREQGSWTIQFNELPIHRFEELFPPRHTQSFSLALACPAGQSIERMIARHRLRPQKLSPLERGDELFAAGEFDEALQQFRLQAESSVESRFRQEALLKQGLCLLELGQTADADAIFQAVMVENSPPWSLHASCRLWLSLLRQGKQEAADQVLDDLSARYQFAELAALIPEDVREQILSHYSDRWIVYGVKLPEDQIVNLERALAVQNLLATSREAVLYASFDLMETYLRTGRDHQALALIDTCINDPTLDRKYFAALIYRKVHLLASKGDLEGALATVERELLDVNGNVRPDRVSLLAIRPAILARTGNWQAAERDLDDLFSRPSESQHAPGLWILRGLIAEAIDGDDKRAIQIWEEGYQAGKQNASTESLQVCLSTISGNATLDGCRKVLEDIILDGEKSAAAHTAVRLIDKSIVPDEAIFALLTLGWNTPRGRDVVRELVLLELPFDSQFNVPHQIMAYGFFKWMAQGSIGLHEPLTADQDEMLWQLTKDMRTAFENDEFQEAQLVNFYFAWSNVDHLLGWNILSRSLQPELRAPLAYLFACRALQTGKASRAESLFAEALTLAKPGSELERLTQAAQKLGRLAALPREGEPLLSADLVGSGAAWQRLKSSEATAAGDDWKSGGGETSAWQQAKFPMRLDTKDAGVLRARIQFQVTEEQAGKPAILELTSPIPAEVFLDAEARATWSGPALDPALAPPPILRETVPVFSPRGRCQASFVVPADSMTTGTHWLAVEFENEDVPATLSVPLTLYLTSNAEGALTQLFQSSFAAAQLRGALVVATHQGSLTDLPEVKASTETALNYGQGLRYVREGQFEKAQALFTQVLDAHPKNAWARRERGMLHLQQRYWQAASLDLDVASRSLFDDARLRSVRDYASHVSQFWH